MTIDGFFSQAFVAQLIGAFRPAHDSQFRMVRIAANAPPPQAAASPTRRPA